MMSAQRPVPSVNWKSVIVYYVIACAISWPFFYWRDIYPDSFNNWNAPGIIKTASYMWGPGIAALICLFVFRKTHQRTMTLFGTSVARSLLFWFVPIFLLCFIGVDNSMGMNAHVYPFVGLGLLGFIIIIGEELGWTGYMQDALRSIPRVKRSVIIGTMWELWHFTNRTHSGPLLAIIIRVSIFIILLSVIAYVISLAIDRSKSTIVAVTIHAWINIIAEFGNSTSFFIVLGISLVFWVAMLFTWSSKDELSIKSRG